MIRSSSSRTILLTIFVSIALVGCQASSALQDNSLLRDPTKIDQAYPPSIVELNIISHGKRLNGLLYQANGPGPHPTVILLHGYPGNEKNLDLAQSMRRAGYNVLFFHYRGTWGSEGEYAFIHVIEDVESAINYLQSNHEQLRVDPDRLLLVGHSMGGFAALQGAARNDSISCVASIAGADLGLFAEMVQSDETTAKSFMDYADGLIMQRGWSGDKFMKELESRGDSFGLAALAPQLSGKSVLLLAGDKDSVVEPEKFHEPLVATYRAAGDINLSHDIISGDHSFSWSRYALIDIVLEWAQNCESTEK